MSKICFKKLSIAAALLIITVLVSGCGAEKIYISDSDRGFDNFPLYNEVSPRDALELAQPYIDYSYELRKQYILAKHKVEETSEVKEYVILKGNYYYVTKEHRVSNDPMFYIPYSVKIHKDTGEIQKP